MFDRLQIYNRRERVAVGVADAALAFVAPLLGRTGAGRGAAPERILLLRLERIGDLLMSLAALEELRRRAPAAHVHLVLGSWNAALAGLLPGVDSHEVLDVPWLARGSAGATVTALARRARLWKQRRFDLGINFEPDLRSNLLLFRSGASRRVGFASGGGGALLTDALDYDRTRHTSDNLLRLVDAALPGDAVVAGSRDAASLSIGAAQRRAIRSLIDTTGPAALVGIHVSGGRPVKQWPVERFAEVAIRLARMLPARVVLTGAAADRPLVTQLKAMLPADVVAIDATGAVDLPAFGALLQELRLFVTGDTGPMHLAAAVGTATVAIFGPSDPRRYGPLTARARVVTAELWCRPCNRVRRPPDRCSHGTPDCLLGVSVEQVMRAAAELLSAPPV